MAKCIFEDFCIACGSCASYAPHIIKGKQCEDPICLYDGEIPEKYIAELQKAVEECPTGNISIED